MRKFRSFLLAATVMLPFVIGACADRGNSIVAPEQGPTPSALLNLSDPMLKYAVAWSSGHKAGTYSTSGVIGSKGGKLSIAQSDFTIEFAAGAVSSPTRITITSIAGKYVSYDMKPHGLRFQAPVKVTQGLRNTAAYSSPLLAKSLVGAYVDNDIPPAPDGSFVATELLPSTTYFIKLVTGLLVPDRQTWQLKHFSRYMLASG